jgi:hypothetical protein
MRKTKFIDYGPTDVRAITAVAYLLYQQGGQDAVINLAEVLAPEEQYSYCYPCKVATPTIGYGCLVCGTAKT